MSPRRRTRRPRLNRRCDRGIGFASLVAFASSTVGTLALVSAAAFISPGASFAQAELNSTPLQQWLLRRNATRFLAPLRCHLISVGALVSEERKSCPAPPNAQRNGHCVCPIGGGLYGNGIVQ